MHHHQHTVTDVLVVMHGSRRASLLANDHIIERCHLQYPTRVPTIEPAKIKLEFLVAIIVGIATLDHGTLHDRLIKLPKADRGAVVL